MNYCVGACDLHMGCSSPKLKAIGNTTNPLLLIMLDSPTRIDDEQGAICSGKGGKYLLDVLKDRIKDTYITSSVKCCPFQNITNPAEGVRIPQPEEIEYCLPNFHAELQSLDPSKIIIMPMGDAPMRALFGREGTDKQDVGDLQYLTINGVRWKVMPNYSPSYILRGGVGTSKESTFKSVIDLAFSVCGEESEEDKIYTIATPSEAVKETKLVTEAFLDKEIDHVLFDCETTGLVPWRDHVFMYSFFAEGVTKRSVAAPLLVSNVIHHEDYPYPVRMVDFQVSPKDKIMIQQAVGDMIKTVPICGHNLKFDESMVVLAERIVKLEDIKLFYDTLLLSHILIGRDTFGALDLKTLCSELFGVPSWDAPVESYLHKFRKVEDRTYDKVPTSIIGKYAAEDTYYNSKLLDLLLSKITDENRNIIKIVHGVQPVFTEAEIKGVCFDMDIFGYIRDSYKDILSGYRKEMIGLCSDWVAPRMNEALEENARKRKPKPVEDIEKAVFNMGSPKQKADILYNYFKMPLIETRKKGKKSSTGGGDKETIAKLLKHPEVSEEGKAFLGTLTKYTALNKLITSYIDNAEDMISDGNIYHPSYNINGAVTGRHSSGFHTLPKKSDIKRLYSTRWKNEGGLIACFDYSQLELRVIASLANEPAWIEAFKHGIDVHTATAAKMFRIPVEEVKSDQRKAAKACLGKNSFVLTDRGFIRPNNLTPDLTLTTRESKSQQWGMVVDSEADTLTVEFDNGIIEEYRPDHRLQVWNGSECEWKEVRDLTSQDEVISVIGQLTKPNSGLCVDLGDYYSQKRCKHNHKVVLDDDWYYFFGLYLGDGSITSKYGTEGQVIGGAIKLVVNNFTSNRITSLFDREEIHYSVDYSKDCDRGYTYSVLSVFSLGLYSLLNTLFPYKDISDTVMSDIGKSGILNLLAGLMDSDGTSSQGLKCFKNTNESLVRKVALLSHAVGIPTRLNCYKAGITLNGVRSYFGITGIEYKKCYELNFHELDVCIPVMTPYKSWNTRKKYRGFHVNPEFSETVYKNVLEAEGGYSRSNKAIYTWDNIRRSKSVVTPVTPYLDLTGLRSNMYMTKVRSKKETRSEIYVIQTEAGHYISSCLISHNCNFGLVYGISDAGLAENIGVSLSEATKLKKAVFAECTGLDSWFAERHRYVDEHHSITTVFGRVIPIDMKTMWNQTDVEANHRRAVNYSVQSPGSDLVTDSIVRIYNNIKKRGLKSILIGSVHDSILFDIYPGELPKIVKIVKYACETENMRMYPWLKCPIVVDATIGMSWGGGIDFKINYEEDGMVFTGEGLRKDFLSIVRSGEGVYDWSYEVLEEELIEEQPKDKVIRDRYNWKAALKLGL